MKITGRIERISIVGTRHAFLVGEKWLSVFVNESVPAETKQLIKSLKEDEEYEFEVEVVKGKKGGVFYNIKEITPIQEELKEDFGDASPEPKELTKTQDTRQRSINLSYATTIVAAMIQSGKLQIENPQDLIAFTTSLAESFDRYINGIL